MEKSHRVGLVSDIVDDTLRRHLLISARIVRRAENVELGLRE
jgi:hypothetical protein